MWDVDLVICVYCLRTHASVMEYQTGLEYNRRHQQCPYCNRMSCEPLYDEDMPIERSINMLSKPLGFLTPVPHYAIKGSVLPLIKQEFSPAWYKQACLDLSEPVSAQQVSRNFLGLGNEAGELIGTVGWYMPKNCPSTVRALSYFCVDSRYRGQGLGRWMLYTIASYLSIMEVRTLEIHCSYDLPSGLHFYESIGCHRWPKYKAIQRLGKNDVCYRISIANLLALGER